jgi:putative pyruvate formate lyase activating enzyme
MVIIPSFHCCISDPPSRLSGCFACHRLQINSHSRQPHEFSVLLPGCGLPPGCLVWCGVACGVKSRAGNNFFMGFTVGNLTNQSSLLVMNQHDSGRREFCRKILTMSCAGILPLNAEHSFMNSVQRKSSNDFQPGYLKLHASGELKARAEVLWEMMRSCRLCPRECDKNRLGGGKGDYCNATGQLQVSSYNPHFGEEKPLVGRNGSGTIFMTNCSMLCVFCINWEISQRGSGRDTSIRQLSNMMLQLQKTGCHNINIVSPTHYSAHLLYALDDAAGRGLVLPVVYNTSGWERLEVLHLLDGIIDIYLSDFKYFDPEMADKYSPGAASYPEITKSAVIEMNRQVGVADPMKNNGILQRGLIIRHLVMPNKVSGTSELMAWIAANLPRDTYINLMSQYTPVFNARLYPEISRRITVREYQEAVRSANAAGLTNLDLQGA